MQYPWCWPLAGNTPTEEYLTSCRKKYLIGPSRQGYGRATTLTAPLVVAGHERTKTTAVEHTPWAGAGGVTQRSL